MACTSVWSGKLTKVILGWYCPFSNTSAIYLLQIATGDVDGASQSAVKNATDGMISYYPFFNGFGDFRAGQWVLYTAIHTYTGKTVSGCHGNTLSECECSYFQIQSPTYHFRVLQTNFRVLHVHMISECYTQFENLAYNLRVLHTI